MKIGPDTDHVHILINYRDSAKLWSPLAIEWYKLETVDSDYQEKIADPNYKPHGFLLERSRWTGPREPCSSCNRHEGHWDTKYYIWDMEDDVVSRASYSIGEDVIPFDVYYKVPPRSSRCGHVSEEEQEELKKLITSLL